MSKSKVFSGAKESFLVAFIGSLDHLSMLCRHPHSSVGRGLDVQKVTCMSFRWFSRLMLVVTKIYVCCCYNTESYWQLVIKFGNIGMTFVCVIKTVGNEQKGIHFPHKQLCFSLKVFYQRYVQKIYLQTYTNK